MHARHRSPGNGYRSSTMGMGMGFAGGSRISPETSGRGHGFYNSDYRSGSFKRGGGGGGGGGFGRGHNHPKSSSFQPHPPTPRKATDIFMEAGRLAAEYLVSQGLLPPTALPAAKWQNNGSLKKQVGGDYQDFRSQEGDSLQLPPEGRPSALSRLGNANSDMGFGRRRYLDDYSPSGSRNFSKGRRKEGSYRSYSSDWGREYGRSGSWSDRNRVSPDMEFGNDNVSAHDEPEDGKDVGSGLQRPASSEFAPKSEEFENSEFDDKYNLQGEVGSVASSSASGKDLKLETDNELSKRGDDSTDVSAEAGELKDGNDNDDNEKEGTIKDLSYQHSTTGDDTSGKTSADLLAFCKFAKVPTKIRSSLTLKNLKADSVSIQEQESFSDIQTSTGPQVLLEDDSLGGSSGDTQSNKSQDSKFPNPEVSKDLSVQSLRNVGELDHIYGVEQGKCTRSQSFPDRALFHDSDQELVQGMLGLQRSSSMVVVKERGEKRSLEQSDSMEGAKKPREWLQPVTTKAEFVAFSDFGDKKVGSVDGRATPSERVGEIQDDLVSNPHFANGNGESSVNYAQEKQLFPNAFKICDLNLMEASDINENHHNDPIILYSTAPETKNETATLDIDLSMSNSNNSGGGNRHTSGGKEIEVIDLENDTAQEEKAVDNLERKNEPMFGSMNGDMADDPDQYDGLTLTEFLRNFSNCASDDINPHPLQNENINPLQTEDINPLQNEMGLHNEEGTLGDDDSIYMSLGEIPLSFLPAWEQPPAREYEKPF